jgi:hypothetical protein
VHALLARDEQLRGETAMHRDRWDCEAYMLSTAD